MRIPMMANISLDITNPIEAKTMALHENLLCNLRPWPFNS